MKLPGKIIASIVGTMILLPLVLFAIYDICYFQPRNKEISKVFATEAFNMPLPSIFPSLIEAEFGGSTRTASFAARYLIDDLHIEYRNNHLLGWHPTFALWTMLVWLHIPFEKQAALISSRAYMGNYRYGFSTESSARFGKQLSQLTPSEAATIVALIHAPSYYETHPDELAKRREQLLRELPATSLQ